MESFVWAAVVLTLGIIAAKVALELGGRKMATKEDVAAVAKVAEKLSALQLEMHGAVEKVAKAADAEIDELRDRVDAIDQRTSPDPTVQQRETKPGRRLG